MCRHSTELRCPSPFLGSSSAALCISSGSTLSTSASMGDARWRPLAARRRPRPSCRCAVLPVYLSIIAHCSSFSPVLFVIIHFVLISAGSFDCFRSRLIVIIIQSNYAHSNFKAVLFPTNLQGVLVALGSQTCIGHEDIRENTTDWSYIYTYCGIC